MPAHPAARLHALLCAACLAAGGGTGVAGEDHDRARQALEAGEILPLRTILDRVERAYPGQVIDVELERDPASPRWIYEIKVLQGGGTLLRLKVDARDGTILSRKERPRHGHEHGRD
jgi:uncharacterized membrane protein YkoI